jgi:hypothetical protein
MLEEGGRLKLKRMLQWLQRQSEDDEGGFGRCPICGGNDGYLNVGRDHWFKCDRHRMRWCAGSNLLSSWRYETPKDWERNRALLENYENVEVFTDDE